MAIGTENVLAGIHNRTGARVVGCDFVAMRSQVITLSLPQGLSPKYWRIELTPISFTGSVLRYCQKTLSWGTTKNPVCDYLCLIGGDRVRFRRYHTVFLW